MKWFKDLQNKFNRYMLYRHGFDTLNLFLVLCYFSCAIGMLFIENDTLMFIVSLFFIALFFYRFFSKDRERRCKENADFINIKYTIERFFRKRK